VPASETIELMAFMEAADESKRQGGKPVSVPEVLEKARAKAKLMLKERVSRGPWAVAAATASGAAGPAGSAGMASVIPSCGA
jgi:hypothetical protein